MDAAFRNRDGSTALVVHNENDDPRSFAVTQGGSLVRVHAARRRAGHVHVAGLAGARRRPRSLRAGSRHRRGGQDAVDDDATTRWTPGRGAGAGPVAPGGPRPRRSACAGSCSTRAPTSATSRAATRCYTSTDGTHWSERATGAGNGQLTTIDIPATGSALPARRPDRDRAAVVVGRRPAGLPLRRRVHDQVRADPAILTRGGARARRGPRLDGRARLQGPRASRSPSGSATSCRA